MLSIPTAELACVRVSLLRLAASQHGEYQYWHCCVSAPFLLEKKQKLAKKKTHVISSSRIWTYNLSPHMIHSYHPTYISFAQLYGVLFILASIFLKFDQLFKCQNHIKSKAFQLKNRRSFRKPNNFHIQVSTDSY